jgi:hypothetical protein
MKVPAEFEEVFQGVELTDKEVRFLGWIIGWDNWTIQNMRTVLQKVRAAGDGGTLPQPSNEPPPCYRPDGDGCAYQCYDGDDEPIDKCKECPLCYSDKQRHKPSNEPLTLEELREMDGEPVWCKWLLPEDRAIEQGKWFIVISGDEAGLEIKRPAEYGCHFCKIDDYGKTWLAYRRPPEGEEDA